MQAPLPRLFLWLPLVDSNKAVRTTEIKLTDDDLVASR